MVFAGVGVAHAPCLHRDIPLFSQLKADGELVLPVLVEPGITPAEVEASNGMARGKVVERRKVKNVKKHLRHRANKSYSVTTALTKALSRTAFSASRASWLNTDQPHLFPRLSTSASWVSRPS